MNKTQLYVLYGALALLLIAVLIIWGKQSGLRKDMINSMGRVAQNMASPEKLKGKGTKDVYKDLSQDWEDEE